MVSALTCEGLMNYLRLLRLLYGKDKAFKNQLKGLTSEMSNSGSFFFFFLLLGCNEICLKDSSSLKR